MQARAGCVLNQAINCGVMKAGAAWLMREESRKTVKRQKLHQTKSLEQVVGELEEAFLYKEAGNLYRFVIEAAEKPLIEHALMRAEGNQLRAAKMLGINRNTLRSKIKKLGIIVK
jgi:DNA-binding protein Fis